MIKLTDTGLTSYCTIFLIDGVSDEDSDNDKELRIKVQPSNNILFVYQSKWQRRLLARLIIRYY